MAHHSGRLRSLAPWCQKVECNLRRLRRADLGARKSWRPPDSRHAEARSSITRVQLQLQMQRVRGCRSWWCASMLGLSKMHLQVQASSKLVLARVYGRKRNARRQRGDAVSQKKKKTPAIQA